MPTVVLVGAQWGDEGKGKIADFVASKSDMVVRYSGGANAGHTVVIKGTSFKLHHIPSGIFHDRNICVIASGVVVDPPVFFGEVAALEREGLKVANLRLSEAAHIVMPYHKELDRAQEMKRGAARIGTTMRGIGPVYADKAARSGLRVGDLLDGEMFLMRLKSALEEKNAILEQVYGLPGLDYGVLAEEYLGYGEKFRRFATDTGLLVQRAIDEGKKVVFEGAQGTFLDLDHGTYPYVTSSSSTAGGACTGVGVGPKSIDRVVGIAKAYTTRVGEGPFPAEVPEDEASILREIGREYGTTTGRPRRCGWADTVMLKYAARVNGFDYLALTKLDVLDGFEKIRICVAYEYNGQIIQNFPLRLDVQQRCRPVWEEMPGWKEDISGARSYRDLPVQARRYVERLEELSGVKVALIGVGADREEIIVKEPEFLGF